MGTEQQNSGSTLSKLLYFPIWLITWPIVHGWRFFYKRFVSFLIGASVRDDRRIYSVKFIWYGDSVYLHPLVWGSVVLYFFASTGIFGEGWPLLVWFIMLFVCFLTVMYNFNIIRCTVLAMGIVAVLGVAYFSTMEFGGNPLAAIEDHIIWLDVKVSPGFYIAAAYLFAACIAAEVLWAWLFHRVEIDESYVYEYGFLKGTVREPIFARGLKRETKDLLELVILGAADIEHRTRTGMKRYRNVPFGSLWLGSAIDSLLDYRRKGEVDMQKQKHDDTDQVRISDAMPDTDEDASDVESPADGNDDDADDAEMPS